MRREPDAPGTAARGHLEMPSESHRGSPPSHRHSKRNTLQPKITKVRQAGKPELHSFGLRDPQTQKLLLTVQVNSQRDVHRVRRNLRIAAADMHDDAVEKDDRKDLR